MRKTALIVGAGIGGLTTAIALAQQDLNVILFERSPALIEVGAGLQLSANAMHVLNALKLRSAIAKVGFEPKAATFLHHATGQEQLSTSLLQDHQKRYGQPYYHIHRADLQKILIDAAKASGVTLKLNAPVQNYHQHKDSVRLTLENGEIFEGAFLVGADGIKSTIRTQMLGKEEAHFTGQVAWRGTVGTHKLSKDLIPQNANIWLGPNRHFVSYYIKGGDLINFVAVEERSTWHEESWNQKGHMEDVRKAFQAWDPRIRKLLAACDQCYLWGLFDRPSLSKWCDGNVTLLGDACHPMLPFMAQGAAMAIEDAFVLSKMIGTHSTIEQAFHDYEIIRKPRVTMLQKISRQNAQMFHAHALPAVALRTLKFKIGSTVPAAVNSQLDRIYGVDVTK